MSSSRSLGTLTLDLVTKLNAFEPGMDKAARISKKTSTQIGDDAEQAANRAKNAYSGMAALALGALGGLSVGAIFKTIIDETKMAEQEQSQLAAVLRSTGEAAGFNRDQLNSMAGALEGKSIFSAGDINQAQTALLAFTGVMGGEFVRAQQAAADMASRTGMSIQSATETIGRALDVPSQGLAALSRQGFKFTTEQKELAEALESVGKTAEAQAIVLDALETSYGGAAQAARDTFGGALDGIRNTITGLLTGQDGSLEGARLAIEALNMELSKPESAAAFSALVSTIASGAGVVVQALAAIPWEKTSTAVVLVASVLAGRLAGAAATSALSMVAATVETLRYQAALAGMAGVSARAAVGITAVGMAGRAAAGAMALLGGPVGLAIAAGSALLYFATSATESKNQAEGLKTQIDFLNTSFEGFTRNQAEAALVGIRKELASAQLKALDAGGAVNRLAAELDRTPRSSPKFQELSEKLVIARGSFDDASQAATGLNSKITELMGIIASVQNADAAGSFVSKTFKEMSATINERILLIGKETEAQKLQARIGAGLVKGLAAGEGDQLVALLKTEEAKDAAWKAEKERQAKAKSAAASAITSAASAAKATEQRAADAVRDYQRQIELINTTTDKRNQASEVAKLAFELESGKLRGISQQRKDELRQLAAELDLKQKLKQENEDAAKLAAFAANLKEQNQTVASGFELELAGAGMGDKYKLRLREMLEIQQAFNRDMQELQKQQNAGEITQELYDKETEMLRAALAERTALQDDFWKRQDEAQSNWLDGVSAAWENYRDTANNYQQQAADFTSGTLNDLTGSVGDNLAAMALEGQSLGDTFKNIASTMASSIINALSQMAAQWLVYQAVQLAVGQSTKAAASVGLIGIAEATALQAALAAFASTAAIPIVGPAAAPAAAAAAAAFTLPLVAGVAASTMVGMAHDGIDSIPQTGTWLLEKGERVTTAETSAKLDAVLGRVDSKVSGASGQPIVNLIEDRSRAGQVKYSQNIDRQAVIDIFVADIRGGGEVAETLERTYPMSRTGR